MVWPLMQQVQGDEAEDGAPPTPSVSHPAYGCLEFHHDRSTPPLPTPKMPLPSGTGRIPAMPDTSRPQSAPHLSSSSISSKSRSCTWQNPPPLPSSTTTKWKFWPLVAAAAHFVGKFLECYRYPKRILESVETVDLTLDLCMHKPSLAWGCVDTFGILELLQML